MDYHCLESSINSRYITTVYHLDVPVHNIHNKGGLNGNTSVSLRDALVASIKHEQGITGDIASVLPDISSGELTKINSGELYEYVEQTKMNNVDWNRIEKRDKLRNKHTTYSTSKINKLKKKLKFWDYNDNVPD